MPRQMPSSGVPEANAASIRASSQASRSRAGGPGAGVGLGAVAYGLDVRAARDDQAVEAGDDRGGVRRVVRRQHRRDAARRLDEARVPGRQQRRVAAPTRPSAPRTPGTC